MKESDFQSRFIQKLHVMFECIITKNDAGYLQGIPDLSVLCNGKYALLECKDSSTAKHRPNQDYYVNWVNANNGFAAFVYPENEDEIITQLQDYFDT